MKGLVYITRELIETIPEESARAVEVTFIVDSYDPVVAKEFLNSINGYVDRLNAEIESKKEQ